MGWLIVPILIVALMVGLAAIAELRSARDRARVLRLAGFHPTITYKGLRGAAGIALDPSSRQIAITRYRQNPLLLGFDDVVSVEIVKNGSTLTSTNRGSQVAGATVGALLLGPAGLIIGGLSGSRRSVERTARLSMKLYTTDLVTPVHEIVFFTVQGVGLRANSPLVVSAARLLDEWYGRLQSILHSQLTT
jgi:hypothetical protein